MSARHPGDGSLAQRLRFDFDRSFAVPSAFGAAPVQRFLAIRVAGDPYAVALAQVSEVHAERRVARLPLDVPELLGVANVRGVPTPVYDLAVCLGYAPGGQHRATLLVRGSLPLGLAFDAVEVNLEVGAAAVVTARTPDSDAPARERAAPRRACVEAAREPGFGVRHHCAAREVGRPAGEGGVMIEWTFGRRMALGFAIAGLTLIVIAGFGLESTYRLIENDRWVAHTQTVRRSVTDTLSYMKDAETGQRGFVITGDESFLEPYRAGLAPLDRSYGELQQLTADNPLEQRRLLEARPLVDAKLAELKLTIEMRRTQGFEPTASRVAAGEGKHLMDRIRELFGEIDADETALLAQRRAEAESSAATTRAVLVGGSVGGVILVILAGVYVARQLGRQLGDAAAHMQASSTELQSAATQQATGAREQATAMTEISTTISELIATSRQIAESAQRVAQIAEQTAAAARAGEATVDLGTRVAGRRSGARWTPSSATCCELGKKSQQIGAVLDVVGELAEQTNILAINATIEAAGAGESGKRFGVVADEIRKLADRVGGSTKEIRVLVEDVRTAVNTTVMTTETGSKAVEAGTRQFGDVTTSFKQIAAQVATTTEAAREIELSTKQQASAVEQVNIAIVNVAQASKETRGEHGADAADGLGAGRSLGVAPPDRAVPGAPAAARARLGEHGARPLRVLPDRGPRSARSAREGGPAARAGTGAAAARGLAPSPRAHAEGRGARGEAARDRGAGARDRGRPRSVPRGRRRPRARGHRSHAGDARRGVGAAGAARAAGGAAAAPRAVVTAVRVGGGGGAVGGPHRRQRGGGGRRRHRRARGEARRDPRRGRVAAARARARGRAADRGPSATERCPRRATRRSPRSCGSS